MRQYIGSISAFVMALFLLGLGSIWSTYDDWMAGGGTLGFILSNSEIGDALYDSFPFFVVPFTYTWLGIPFLVAGLLNRAKSPKSYVVTAVLLGIIYVYVVNANTHWSTALLFYFVSLPFLAAPWALGAFINKRKCLTSKSI